MIIQYQWIIQTDWVCQRGQLSSQKTIFSGSTGTGTLLISKLQIVHFRHPPKSASTKLCSAAETDLKIGPNGPLSYPMGYECRPPNWQEIVFLIWSQHAKHYYQNLVVARGRHSSVRGTYFLNCSRKRSLCPCSVSAGRPVHEEMQIRIVNEQELWTLTKTIDHKRKVYSWEESHFYRLLL